MVNYKELVEFIVKHLVTQPDSVEVENGEEDDGSKILIRVAHEDVGRVIG
ncbi:MAG: KH domain-containing protein, partial [Synergistaceae bacterium]|nr:KH domain-containing protein [Synergistaceae bacterium]